MESLSFSHITAVLNLDNVFDMKNKRRRDDFSAKVIRVLRDRVNNHCSNPDCNTQTTGPNNDALRVENIGKAAHISAASPGGPRYDKNISSEDRKSIANAIWLCSNCSTKIDSNEKDYSKELLHEWKKIAEDSAKQKLNKRPAHPDDAKNQLAVALGGIPKHLALNAISNTHKASEDFLHTLDSRFLIKSSYQNKETTFDIHARERVGLKLRIPQPDASEWHLAWEKLRDHGMALKLPASGLKIIGSPLFEYITGRQTSELSSVVIEPVKRKAIQKIRLINPIGQQIENLDDMQGFLSIGQKSCTFYGETYDGLLSITWMKLWDQNVGDKTDLTVSFNSDCWSGKDIRTLPFFEKIHNFIKLIISNWQLDLSTEIEGVNFLSGNVKINEFTDYFERLESYFKYINDVKKIANYINTPIKFLSSHTITRNDFEEVFAICQKIDGSITHNKFSLNSNPTCVMVATEKGQNIVQLLNTPTEDILINFVSDLQSTTIFNQLIVLPKTEVTMTGFTPKISTEIAQINAGEEVRVEFVPKDNFKCQIFYMK